MILSEFKLPYVLAIVIDKHAVGNCACFDGGRQNVLGTLVYGCVVAANGSVPVRDEHADSDIFGGDVPRPRIFVHHVGLWPALLQSG